MLLPILAAAVTPAVTAAPQQPVQVMVLGSYHFGNPGRDKVNAHVDDVTTPQRQRELEALLMPSLSLNRRGSWSRRNARARPTM